MTVNKDRIELLCQALESERYVQCRHRLRTELVDTGKSKWSYCALGVAIDVAVQNGLQIGPIRLENWYYDHGSLPWEVQMWYGFEDSNPDITLDDFDTAVASANDDGADFWTISQAIRARYLKDFDDA
jgi:hypothetical protein